MNQSINCEELRQELFLGSIDTSTPAMQEHLRSCAQCREFAKFTQHLDARLHVDAQRAKLSPQLRMKLRARLRREGNWPEYLPVLAHTTGCAAAMAAMLFFWPAHWQWVLGLGSAFTALSYFSQALLSGWD